MLLVYVALAYTASHRVIDRCETPCCSHLGKRSYAERGCSELEYQIYWDGFVWPRWKEHGDAHLSRVAENSLRLDPLTSTEAQVASVLATGWLKLR